MAYAAPLGERSFRAPWLAPAPTRRWAADGARDGRLHRDAARPPRGRGHRGHAATDDRRRGARDDLPALRRPARASRPGRPHRAGRPHGSRAPRPGVRQRTGLRVRGGAGRHAGPLGRRDPSSPAQPSRSRRRPGRAARGRPHRGRAGRGTRGLVRPARRSRGREPPGPPECPWARRRGHDLRPDPRAPPTLRPSAGLCPDPRPRAPETRMARPMPAPAPEPTPEPAAVEPVEDLAGAHPGSRRGARRRPGARRRRRPRTPCPAPPLPRPAGRRRRASVARHPARHGPLGLASRTPGPGAVAQPAAAALVGAH